MTPMVQVILILKAFRWLLDIEILENLREGNVFAVSSGLNAIGLNEILGYY